MNYSHYTNIIQQYILLLIMSKNNKIIIFGKHSCIEALKNPERVIEKIFVTKNSLKQIEGLAKNIKTEILTNAGIDNIVKQPSHQGIAIQAYPLKAKTLNDVKLNSTIIILDHINNPRNIGSILRTSAAFDTSCVILTKKHSPNESGALTKSACGAFEKIPLVRVINLSCTIKELKKKGYWCVGLETGTNSLLHNSKLPKKTALILGSEGKGLRELTCKSCDEILKIKMTDKIQSLNVSNAAAIAMHHIYINSA